MFTWSLATYSWGKGASPNKNAFSKYRPSRPMLSISRNVRMFVCLSAVCLFTFEVPFNGLFAPTSRNWMSNIFWDSESLEKSNGKKWSQIWTFWFESGLKSRNKKIVFLADFALQNMVETTLPDGLETSGRRVYRSYWHISRHFWVFAFLMICSLFQKNLVFGYWVLGIKVCWRYFHKGWLTDWVN